MPKNGLQKLTLCYTRCEMKDCVKILHQELYR